MTDTIRTARRWAGVASRCALALQWLLVVPAMAKDRTPPSDPPWEVIVSPYVWAQSIQGHETVRDVKLDVDVSFRDILERLDLGIMGVVEVRYGEWRLAADVLWASLSETSSRDTLLGPVKTKLDLTQVVADFLAGRRVFSQPATWLPWSRRIDDPRRLDVDLFAGARYWYLENRLKLRVSGVTALTSSSNSDWADPILGIRVQLGLTDRFGLSVRGDVGGFGIGSSSDLTWQAWGGLGYRLSDRWTSWAAYRALGLDRKEGGIRSDLVMQGPLLGVSFHFR